MNFIKAIPLLVCLKLATPIIENLNNNDTVNNGEKKKDHHSVLATLNNEDSKNNVARERVRERENAIATFSINADQKINEAKCQVRQDLVIYDKAWAEKINLTPRGLNSYNARVIQVGLHLKTNLVSFDEFYAYISRAREEIKELERTFIADFNQAMYVDQENKIYFLKGEQQRCKNHLKNLNDDARKYSYDVVKMRKIAESTVFVETYLKILDKFITYAEKAVKEWRKNLWDQLKNKSIHELEAYESRLWPLLQDVEKQLSSSNITKEMVDRCNVLKESIQIVQALRYLKQAESCFGIKIQTAIYLLREKALAGLCAAQHTLTDKAVDLFRVAGKWPYYYASTYYQTTLQREAMNEIVDFINAIAEKVNAMDGDNKFDAKLLIKVVDAAYKACQSGAVYTVWTYLDLGHNILNSVPEQKSILERGTQSTLRVFKQAFANTYHFFTRPDETIVGLFIVFYRYAEILEKCDLGDMSSFIPTERQAAELEKFVREYQPVIKELENKIKELTLADGIEHSAQFLLETAMMSGLLRSIATMGNLGKTRFLITLEKAKKASRGAKTLTALEEAFLKSSQELSLSIDAKVVEINESVAARGTRLIEKFGFKELNPALGNLEKIEKAAHMFKDMPSAMAKDGPLSKFLECAKVEASFYTAKGAAYELEVAYDLVQSGEKVIEFGKRIKGGGQHLREFDIVTEKRLIECKSIDWSRYPIDQSQNMQKVFIQQSKIAEAEAKIFEVRSRNPLNNDWKNWFKKQGINIIEGDK